MLTRREVLKAGALALVPSLTTPTPSLYDDLKQYGEPYQFATRYRYSDKMLSYKCVGMDIAKCNSNCDTFMCGIQNQVATTICNPNFVTAVLHRDFVWRGYKDGIRVPIQRRLKILQFFGDIRYQNFDQGIDAAKVYNLGVYYRNSRVVKFTNNVVTGNVSRIDDQYFVGDELVFSQLLIHRLCPDYVADTAQWAALKGHVSQTVPHRVHKEEWKNSRYDRMMLQVTK